MPSVGDTQTSNTTGLGFRISDSYLVGPHPGGTAGMVGAVNVLADTDVKLGIGSDMGTERDLRACADVEGDTGRRCRGRGGWRCGTPTGRSPGGQGRSVECAGRRSTASPRRGFRTVRGPRRSNSRPRPVPTRRLPPDSGRGKLSFSEIHAGAAQINHCHRRNINDTIFRSEP